MPLKLKVNPAVLGQATLSNVQMRHNLQAGNDRALQRFNIIWNGNIDQQSINTITNAQIIVERLYMDIRGSLLQRLPNDLVDKFNNTCLLIIIGIDNTGLICRLEIVVIKVTPLQNLLKRICSDTVKFPQCLMNAPT